MPIKKIENINNETFWGIWKITETYEELYNMVTLAPEDHAILEGIRHQQKKLEWLAGRVLVKKLSQKLNLNYKGLKKDQYGKPYIRDCNAEISITHSYPQVAAIISNQFPVGIDLEQPKDKLKAIAHKFLSDAEQIHAGDDLKKLCIYWCAKETLYKIYAKKKVIFNKNLKISPFMVRSNGELTGEICMNGLRDSHQLRYEMDDGFIVIFNYQ